MIYYTSKYGTSKRAAHWIAQELNEKERDIAFADGIEEGEIPVIVMPLYAGGFYQAKKAVRLLDRSKKSELILVSVGLSDPKREDTKKAVEQAAARTFPGRKVHLFSTRGGIDYDALSAKDRTMMWMLKKMVEKNPDEGENRQILDTYGQKVDLSSRPEAVFVAGEIREIRNMEKIH